MDAFLRVDAEGDYDAVCKKAEKWLKYDPELDFAAIERQLRTRNAHTWLIALPRCECIDNRLRFVRSDPVANGGYTRTTHRLRILYTHPHSSTKHTLRDVDYLLTSISETTPIAHNMERLEDCGFLDMDTENAEPILESVRKHCTHYQCHA